MTDSGATRPLAASPRVGASVYVRGLGPGTVQHINDDDQFEVVGPSGSVHTHRQARLVEPTRRFDYLRPAADDPSRQVNSASAIFSLLSTMVGGGVLSLPYAFRASGLLLSFLATVVSALVSGFTLDMLIGACRATGCDSYELVAKRAFGRRGSMITMILILLLTWLAQVAYLVLIADLMGPVLKELGVGHHVSNFNLRCLLIFGSVILVIPVCLQSSLHALRFMSFVALSALTLVVVTLTHHAVTTFGTDHFAHISNFGKEQRVTVTFDAFGSKLLPDSWSEALYVFPIYGVSFLCHFNVLPVHGEMVNPTRHRTKRVVSLSMLACIVLYLIAGYSGYIFAGSWTCGNILLNFSSGDVLVTVARVALSFTLFGTFPLLVMPGRANLHRFISSLKSSSRNDEAQAPSFWQSHISESASTPQSAEAVTATTPAPPKVHVYDRETKGGAELVQVGRFLPRDEANEELVWSRAAFISETMFLVFTSLVVACFLDSILVVWTIMGATVSFTIAFILPCLIWIKLHSHQAARWKVLMTKGVLCCSVVAAVACTYEVVINLNHPVCPSP